MKKISEYNSEEKQSKDIEKRKFLALAGSKNAIVKKREFLKEIIDEPCLKACEILYDKNIQTVNSSANKTNIGNSANVTINFDTLNSKNKSIARELAQRGIIKLNEEDEFEGETAFEINVPIKDDMDGSIVSEKLAMIASLFAEQDVLFGRISKDKMIENCIKFADIMGLDVQKIEEVPEDYKEYVINGYIYDSETDEYWATEELLRKHNEYLRKKVQENQGR